LLSIYNKLNANDSQSIIMAIIPGFLGSIILIMFKKYKLFITKIDKKNIDRNVEIKIHDENKIS